MYLRSFMIKMSLGVIVAVGLFPSVTAREEPPPPPDGNPAEKQAVRKAPRGGGPIPMKHPLLVALENSNDFSPEERARLTKLSMEDPTAFNREMRKRFILRRKENAKKMMALREAYLKTAEKDGKEKILDSIRQQIQKETEEQISFQKKILAETEKSIKLMNERLSEMKKHYLERERTKNDHINRQIQQLIDPKNPPKRLLRDLNRSFNNVKSPDGGARRHP